MKNAGLPALDSFTLFEFRRDTSNQTVHTYMFKVIMPNLEESKEIEMKSIIKHAGTQRAGVFILATLMLIVLGACQSATPVAPSVTVSDQAIIEGTVTISEVVSDGDGWLVIHADGGSGPGMVIGHAAVSAGENADVLVEIDVDNATPRLFAMLHTDAGEAGNYEFPGDDVPVSAGGSVVTPVFQVTGGLPAVTPSVTVSDQDIVEGTVIIAEVVSDGAGWLVIHADGGGGPGMVIGHAAVSYGVNTDVVVEIDIDNATPRQFAMLHTDAGEAGNYEFPGDDGPVAVDGNVVTPAFQVTGGLPALTPSVTVSDQDIVEGTVTIVEVVSDGAGWLVIHADGGSGPGMVIGHATVSYGVNIDVVVKIDIDNATPRLFAMLHTDAGETGNYEFPGDDGPVAVDGNVVTPAFHVTGGLPALTPSVTVSDQDIVEGTVTIAEVVSDGSGWLVIHADGGGGPGMVIGHAAVSYGVNTDVVVELDMENVTDKLFAMLHTDAGVIGTYEFPGDDGPVRVDGNVVTPSFQANKLD